MTDLLNMADLRGIHVQPVEDANRLIDEATQSIPDKERRGEAAKWLAYALRTDDRPSRPDLPEKWLSQPNVMFEFGTPQPEPFNWRERKWATIDAYDEELADLLGELACGPDAPEARTRGLARRALATFGAEPDRVWPALFAARVIGAECPPAEALPGDMRRQLEELAARGDAAVAAPQVSPPDE